MAAFNEILDVVFEECPDCGARVHRSVQFAFGDTWQHRYHLGDRLVWGGNDVGEPGHALVVADGYVSPCPVCGADTHAGRYDVRIESGIIASVVPSTGTHDFLRGHTSYVVVEP